MIDVLFVMLVYSLVINLVLMVAGSLLDRQREARKRRSWGIE